MSLRTPSFRTPVGFRGSLMIAAAVALLATACDTQLDPNAPGAGARRVTVVGTGQVQGVPDLLTVEAGVEFVAADVSTAMNQTSERQQAVINALIDAGLPRNDISTTSVSLQPQYTSPDSSGNTPVSGFRASNTIRVKVEPESASQVLSVISSNGGDATRISSVTYSIEDDSGLLRDARQRAFDDAKDRAEQYAELSGLTLGRMLSVSETSQVQPAETGEPRPRGAGTMTTLPPLEPGQQTMSFTVTAVWELTG